MSARACARYGLCCQVSREGGLPASAKRFAPPVKKTPGKLSFQSTESGGRSVLPACRHRYHLGGTK